MSDVLCVVCASVRLLTSVEVEALSIDQILQNVALLLEILGFAQHRDQLVHLCVRKVCVHAMALNENFGHSYFSYFIKWCKQNKSQKFQPKRNEKE